MNKPLIIAIIFIALLASWLLFQIKPRDHEPIHVSSNLKNEYNKKNVTPAETIIKKPPIPTNEKDIEKPDDFPVSTTTHDTIPFEEDTVNTETKAVNTPLALADINSMNANELVEIIKSQKDQPYTGDSPINFAMNRLFSMSSEGDPVAVYELIDISYKFDGHEIEHRIFQALGRARQPDANQALTDAIGRHLDNNKRLHRITSYIRPTVYSNTLEPFIVDSLIGYSEEPGLHPEAKKVLINKVMRMGGVYGRDQLRSHSLR